MNYLLDTHTWIWWNQNPSALSKAALEEIRSGRYDRLLLSSISVWEFSKLVSKRRIAIGIDGWTWIERALKMPCLKVVPLTPEVAWHSSQLPQPFHDDPADQVIVATARAENATIITADRLIQNYPHVRSFW